MQRSGTNDPAVQERRRVLQEEIRTRTEEREEWYADRLSREIAEREQELARVDQHVARAGWTLLIQLQTAFLINNPAR